MTLTFKFLYKFTISIFIIVLNFTSYTLAQDIGWRPYTSWHSSAKYHDKASYNNRVHYLSYDNRNLSNIKDEELEIKVKKLGINKVVKNKLPNFKNILTQKLIDNDMTISSSAYLKLVLDIETFRSNKIISFFIRLHISKYYVKKIPERNDILNKILWENMVFGFVNDKNAGNIREYTMDCIHNLIKDLNKKDL